MNAPIPIINRRSQRILNRISFDSKPQTEKKQDKQSGKLTSIQICHPENEILFRHTVYNTCISPLIIHCSQNNTEQRSSQNKRRSCKNSTQRKKFSNERGCLRYCHIRKSKEEKERTKKGHSCSNSSKVFQSFCMCSFIKIAYTQKQCRTCNSMSQYSKKCTKNSNFVSGKLSKNQQTHMSNTTISNNFFKINLTTGRETRIEKTQKTHCTYKRVIKRTSQRKERKIKSKQPIRSEFQQNTCQQNRTCSTSFYMSFRQPQMERHLRNFHSKSKKKSKPKNQLSTFRELKMSELLIICSASSTLLKQKQRKHSLTSNQCIEHLQIGSFDFSWTCPSQTNKKKHWQQRAFIKNIESQLIGSCETCKLKCSETQEQCIERSTVFVSVLSSPACQNSLRYQPCCLKDHPKTQSILPKFKRNTQNSTPILLKLKKSLKWAAEQCFFFSLELFSLNFYSFKKRSTISLTFPLQGRKRKFWKKMSFLQSQSCSTLNVLRRRLKLWNKIKPQAHCQEGCKQTEKKCNDFMCFCFFPRLKA